MIMKLRVMVVQEYSNNFVTIKDPIMKTIVTIIIFSCSVLPLLSGAITRVVVEGVIVAYDKKTVTLSQNGKKIKVPKNAIPHYFKIRSGNKVYAEFNPKETLRELRQTIQKKKMEHKKNQSR